MMFAVRIYATNDSLKSLMTRKICVRCQRSSIQFNVLVMAKRRDFVDVPCTLPTLRNMLSRVRFAKVCICKTHTRFIIIFDRSRIHCDVRTGCLGRFVSWTSYTHCEPEHVRRLWQIIALSFSCLLMGDTLLWMHEWVCTVRKMRAWVKNMPDGDETEIM